MQVRSLGARLVRAGPIGLAAFVIGLAVGTVASAPKIQIRPPLWHDHDSNPIPQPKEREVSELYAIVYNSWLRSLNLECQVAKAKDAGALNVNAWDEVPDSSWFTNRIGNKPMSFEDILRGLVGKGPDGGEWRVDRIRDEGYTPKLDIRDASGTSYVLKFDLPDKPERNSAAERICTLIMYAAGYNVPHNSIAYFQPERLKLHEESSYRDALRRQRPLTAADLEAMLKRLRARPDGSYRGLASLRLQGAMLGPFVYVGTRQDDPNDIIPHELRREIRGMRVIASWINHTDVKDVNAMDAYVGGQNGVGGFVKHYLLDFGSTMGSGDFVNGPFRVGHEYIYDGSAFGRSFVTLGIWERPWEARGKILYPEVGYFAAELFEPEKWKPNYPNLAFLRMDDGDAFWGAKIVTAFSNELIHRLVEEGDYSRPEVARHVEDAMLKRRDAIGHYWFDRITPLDGFAVDRTNADVRLQFRDLGIERGYADAAARIYRVRVMDLQGRDLAPVLNASMSSPAVPLPERALKPLMPSAPDRWGRRPVARVWIESRRRKGGWALPVEVVVGYGRDSGLLEILGWCHAPRP